MFKTPCVCSESQISTHIQVHFNQKVFPHFLVNHTHMIPWIHFEEGDRVRLSASAMMRRWALIPACAEPWPRSIKAAADRHQNRSVSIRLREEDGESDACYLPSLLSLMLSPISLFITSSLFPAFISPSLSVSGCCSALQSPSGKAGNRQIDSWRLLTATERQ